MQLTNINDIVSIPKSDLLEVSKNLNLEDISELVKLLSLKEDNIRYQAFLLLQNRAILSADVYPYFDIFKEKLDSDNSYQRSIGLMLIAENAKWDDNNRMDNTIDKFLTLLNDEKPITIRQCIQSLGKIVFAKPNLNEKIASKLISIDLTSIKETMQKSILLDILNVLIIIRRNYKTDEIESFISNALSGGILDKKSKKQIEVLL